MKKRNIVKPTALLLGTTIFTNKAIAKFNHQQKNTKHLFYNTKFGKIKYDVYGDGEPILLLHDINIGASSVEWDKNIDILLQKGFKVFTLDLLGFGYSDKPNIEYSPYLYVSLIHNFIENVIEEPTNIVASSLTSNYILLGKKSNPLLYKKIILVNPCGKFISSDKKNIFNSIFYAFDIPIVGNMLYNIICSRPYLRIYTEKNLLSQFSYVSHTRIDKSHKVSYVHGYNGKYALKYYLTKQLNTTIMERFSNTFDDILVIFGDENPFTATSTMNLIKEINPYFKVLKVTNAKMYPHIESPVSFNDKLTTFMCDDN